MHDKPYKAKVYKASDMAKQLNNITYNEYFYRLMLISRALFKWEGLPDYLDEKWIEKYLFWSGGCVFFDHPEIGYMVAQIAETGPMNYYDEPTTIRPIFYNNVGISRPTLENGKDCVIIRNNDDMFPTMPSIKFYALKLANIERTIDVNIQQQKTPKIVHISEQQKLSYQNAIKKRDENETVIFVDKSFDTDALKVHDLTAPIVFDKLAYQKHMVYNECMTFLGVNNANMDKKERVQSAEVAANDNQIQAAEDVMLKARQRAAKDINRIFGLDVKVTRRSAPIGVQQAEETILGTEGREEE